MSRKLPAICFVDDDLQEIRRFCENLKSDFIVGAGTSLSQALVQLQSQGRKKPDLFVLDMYFPEGARNTEEELNELHLARKAFLEAQSRFQSVLGRLRQSSHGGLELANQVRKDYASIGYVFLTRKGNLEDAIRAFDHGALKVVKKPDPNENEQRGKSIDEAYDIAFKNNAGQIAYSIRDAIYASSWRGKYGKAVFGVLIGFLIGVVASLISRGIFTLLG